MDITQGDTTHRPMNIQQITEQIQPADKQNQAILYDSFQTSSQDIKNPASRSKSSQKLKKQRLNNLADKSHFSQQQTDLILKSNKRINNQIYSTFIGISFKSKKKFLSFIIVASILTIALLLYLGALIEKDIKIQQNRIERPYKYVCDSYWLKSQISKKFKYRDQPRSYIPPISNISKDRYELRYSVLQIIKQTYKDTYFEFNPQNIYNYQLAMRLMQVNHNINFKGQFVIDHYNYYSCPEQKYLALRDILSQQKRYFDQKYQIQKYRHNQIRFCIAVTSYNNAKNRVYLRNIESIFQQQYQNYHVVYIDDGSEDGTPQYIKKYLKQNQIPEQKFKLIINPQKKMGGSYNFHNAAHNYCQLGQVIVFIDGDDALIGRQVLALQNAVYQRQKAALTYGQFFAVQIKPSLMYGWSRPVQTQMIRKGTFRSRPAMTTCHLKTMYVDVYRQINLDDFKYANGSFINYSTDVVFMLPAVQMVQQKAIYVNDIIYQYSIGGGINQQLQPQLYAHNYVRLYKTKKQKLKDLSFADFPKTKHYQ